MLSKLFVFESAFFKALFVLSNFIHLVTSEVDIMLVGNVQEKPQTNNN